VPDIMTKYGGTDATNKTQGRRSYTPPEVGGSAIGASLIPGLLQFATPDLAETIETQVGRR
jgi:hypothetical protein